jgi:hypothetical protein
MSANLPIIIDGTTPVVSIATGNFNNAPIYIYLQSLSNLPNIRSGQSITFRNEDGPVPGIPDSGTQPGLRVIYISTYNGNNPDYSVKFNDGTDRVILGSNSGDNFITTVKDNFTWLKEVVVIQGKTQTEAEDITAYGTTVSSMTASSFSTSGPVFVQGNSIFRGPLIGLMNPTFVTAVSTFLFSTGILYTSSLQILEGLQSQTILASTITVTSTYTNNRISSITHYSKSTFTSSISLIDSRTPTIQYNLRTSTNTLFLVTNTGITYTYQTLEQSGFSNISTQMEPALNVPNAVRPLSSLGEIVTTSLSGSRFDSGVSSFSTATFNLLASLGANFGLTNLCNVLQVGVSSLAYVPGLSSVTLITLRGLSTVAAVPGGVNLSTSISVSLSSLNVQPGLSTISSLIAPGVSSITAFVPISSLSTAIATSLSSVATGTGLNNFLITVQSGLSTLATNPGVYNLSSIFSRGISSVAAGPGLSSLSSVIFSTASTFKSGLQVSSFSTVVSFGLSSLAAVTGYSSLVQTLGTGLSSIIDTGYSPYISELGSTISSLITSRGTSSLLSTISFSLSTISDGPGISSISSFFSKSLSGITVAVGVSSIATTITQGLISVLIPMPFTPTYSTASTFISSLNLRDLSSGQYNLVQIKGEDIFVSSMHYPPRLDYLNSSTFSTQVLEIKGSVTMSSLTVSSMNLTSSFTVVGLDTKRTVAQSTLFSSITLTDYTGGFQHLIGTSNGGLFLQNNDGYKQFQNVGAQGISTMSTLFGFGYCNLTQYVNFVAVSSAAGVTLSTITVDPGLSNLEGYGNANIPPNNKNIISTLNVFTSTASFYSMSAVSFSTPYISTQVVSAQTLYLSSFITANAQISTLLPSLSTVRQVLGSLITTSSLSTGLLVLSTLNAGPNTVSSIFQTSSMYVYNSNVYFSTISTGRLYASTFNFGPFSTLFASSGQLYIQTGCNAGSGNFIRFTAATAPNFMAYINGLSVPSISVSSIFTSTVRVSSMQSSFTLDTMAVISSGIYSTTTQQLIVKPDISSLRALRGYQNWTVAQLNASNTSINSVSNSNVLVFFGPSITSQNGWRHPNELTKVGNSVISTMKADALTYALEWDGHKILAGGSEVGNPSKSIQLFIAESGYSFTDTYTSGGPKFTRYTPGCVYPNGNPFTICRDICFNGNQYVAIGDGPNTNNATIKYSYNGITWYDCASGGFISNNQTSYFGTYGGHVVKWDGYKWVAGGSNTSGYGSAVKISYDGINWLNASTLNLGDGRMDRLVYFNNNIWVGTGIFGDCNIKYSYDGINWSNCVWNGSLASGTPSITTGYSNQSLAATPHMVTTSFSGAGLSSNCCSMRSFDGINFSIFCTVGNAWSVEIDQVYDGNYLVGYINNGTSGSGITQGGGVNTMHFAKVMTPILSGGRPADYSEGAFLVSGMSYPGLRGKAVARSNVIPTLSMSNLKIFGSNYLDMPLSTNTIIGHANLAIYSVNANWDYEETIYSERQNYMSFNNTLKIWGNLSTQVIIASPNNPNTNPRQRNSNVHGTNILNLPRATLDVLCTINVRQATGVKRIEQVPAPFYPSSFSLGDQGFDFYVTGSTFMTNVGIGQGANSNAFFSTPTSFFDVYNGGVGSYVTFRGTVSNDAYVKGLLNTTSNAYNVTCYPMVTGANSQLVYYWRNNSQNYRAVDTNGSGFFTGQHPTNCLDISQSNVNQYVGQLVSITTDGYTIYDTSGNQIKGKEAIQITCASPITSLTTKDADPAVFGVVANCFNNGLQSDGTIDTYSDSEFVTDLFGRIMVNCIGEGAIWVTNYGGNVSNGDYLCSCPIPGLSRVQDSGRLMNYTVAKATMSCDFNPPFISTLSTFSWEGSTLSTIVSCLAYQCEPIEFNGSSFMKAFIGCTYHCN